MTDEIPIITIDSEDEVEEVPREEDDYVQIIGHLRAKKHVPVVKRHKRRNQWVGLALPVFGEPQRRSQQTRVTGFSVFMMAALLASGPGRGLPPYVIDLSEVKKKTVWDTHCHLDYLNTKLISCDANLTHRYLTDSFLALDSECPADRFGGAIANFIDPKEWTRGSNGTQVSPLMKACSEETKTYLSIGCHPSHANKWTDKMARQLEKLITGASPNLKPINHIVAIGECG